MRCAHSAGNNAAPADDKPRLKYHNVIVIPYSKAKPFPEYHDNPST